MKKLPNPSTCEINSPEFEAIWKIIKNWDIGAKDYYSGYTSGNGSHVKLILDELRRVKRQQKIDELI